VPTWTESKCVSCAALQNSKQITINLQHLLKACILKKIQYHSVSGGWGGPESPLLSKPTQHLPLSPFLSHPIK
jgi:hypothetical protein